MTEQLDESPSGFRTIRRRGHAKKNVCVFTFFASAGKHGFMSKNRASNRDNSYVLAENWEEAVK